MQNNSKLNIKNCPEEIPLGASLLKSKKILVTATADFIGHALAKKLLERGDTVVRLDNINDYYDVNLKDARLNQLGIDAQAGEAQSGECHGLAFLEATHPRVVFP